MADGQTYGLRFDVNALCELEETVGRSVAKLMDNVDDLGVREIRALLYAGMRSVHRQLTPEAVGKLMDLDGTWLESAMESIEKAFVKAFPDAEDAELLALDEGEADEDPSPGPPRGGSGSRP